MDLSERAKRAAADFLHQAICDAVSDNDPQLCSLAREWLFLDAPPTPEQVFSPHPLGFISACNKIGIDWVDLNQTLIEAINIKEYKRPDLRLVHKSELSYNGSHEKTTTFTDCHQISRARGRFNKLHSPALSLAKV